MFTKKLLSSKDARKLIGIKIATVGFLGAILGVILFLLKAQIIGRVVLYLGFVMVFIGILMNFYILIKSRSEEK
jgi:hypothetical protein